MKQRAAVATGQQPAIDATNMGKIILTFPDSNGDLTINKSFVGEWLVGNGEVEGGGILTEDDCTVCTWENTRWSVARTHKGALVVYVDSATPKMYVYKDFDEMKAERGPAPAPDQLPGNVLAETAIALRLDYEIELDI
jgi:hypothetical protein